MYFGRSLFSNRIEIPVDAQIIVVSDLFVDDYVGGAELTTDALVKSSPYKVFKLHAKDVSMQLLQEGAGRHWVFGNFSQLDANIIPSIMSNLKYSILEYDYKYCRFRSPEKHAEIEKRPCNCHNEMNGKLISAFYHGAEALFWMSEKQRDRYWTLFPFLQERDNIVLSSVFDENTFATIKLLRERAKKKPRKGWIVLGSNSWIKGYEAAEQWCKTNNKEYEVVWNLPYETLLEKLASSEGFVYLPAGGDTCPRMVIEAKLLGCELKLNDNVQHKDEEWFAIDDLEVIESYLYKSREIFWNTIKNSKEHKPSLSGYTTTYNCVSQKYPFEQSIQSMLSFCDEVVVIDGGSNDGTWEVLQSLAKNTEKLKIMQKHRDWNHPRFAVFDGEQKAFARSLCTKEFCWQMDSDEIVHELDAPKIIELLNQFPKGINLICLPVVEYWGGYSKVRVDVNPWKWRLSRNLPSITHGIPGSLRRRDSEGNLYASQGTDGCDMIDSKTLEPIQHLGFYGEEAHQTRMAALQGIPGALQAYENWFNSIIENLPGVFHFSWFDLVRKIKTYQEYWGKHWKSLFDVEIVDTAENNMMFDKPWSEVTDSDIETLATQLREKCGGWVWHRKWDKTNTPSISIRMTPPKLAKEFYK